MDNEYTRELGVLEISIGTSLAIEGLLGKHPDRPVIASKAPIRNVKLVWVNVSTLIRNIYHSLTTEDKERIDATTLSEILLYEMNTIDGLIKQESNDIASTVFYRNKVEGIKKYMPNARLKEAKTPKQKMYEGLLTDIFDDIENIIDGLTYREFDVVIKGSSASIMLTHSPLDLLSYYNFSSLSLLESHTGKVKPKNQWGSKLGSKSTETTPFNGFTMQVFGDGGDKIDMAPLKYRKAVLSLIESDNWTSVTTLPRIKMSVQKLKDDDTREELMKYTTVRSFTM